MAGLSGLNGFGQQEPDERELGVNHAECALFGPKGEYLRQSGLEAGALRKARQQEFAFGRQTMEVAAQLPATDAAAGERSADAPKGTIDRLLTEAWKQAGVTPAARTTDAEFIRRVTLDLTGRIPTAQRVQQFLADTSATKREALVEELLASDGYVDKWTMYFGDLLRNTLRTTQVVRYNEGRNAFYQWIRSAISENKPYDRMARELITATGDNSYEKGELNWVVGGFVTGGPVQDIWDQQAVNTAETFLGIAHFNCLLCHDGRRHLDTMSLWGKSATRLQGYQLSAFYSHTELGRTRAGAAATPYYWSVRDDTPRARTDYALNTTTGNRPARTPVAGTSMVAPQYPFGGGTPAQGENRRAALARLVTADFQFSRAAVNRIWKEFMVKAFVEPVDQFDPARLDPDNPPPSPWTLQPNQPRLLNALAQDFVDSHFDVKKLMRAIVLSDAYQLSSRYKGDWNPAWEDLYARKLVRRLWAEEVHDAVVAASLVPVRYTVPGLGQVSSAMQLPDVVNLPGGTATSWLDSFMRGNRDTELRRSDGSVLQVLNLMNDAFVMSRTKATGAADTGSLLRRALTNASDDQVVTMLFQNVLSRNPSDSERAAALSQLRSGNRQQKAEDLLWALYNKVDFIFNY